MTENSTLPWNSRQGQHSSCCEAYVQPLLERVAHLENRLERQTERRENQYNQIMKMVITGRKENHQQTEFPSEVFSRKRQNSKASRKMTSPSSRRPVIKLPIHKKATQQGVKGDETSKKMSIALVEPNPSGGQLAQRMSACEVILGKQQEQMGKVKELNDYLMGQLLGVFEKIKDFDELSQLVRKTKASQETVTSLVFDQQNPTDSIKIVNKQNNSSSRMTKSDFSRSDLGQIANKVSEHEGMLADLIELTKNLSCQIKNLPPEWGISPRSN